MKDGFIKIACATPDVKVADCRYNADRIIELITEAHCKGVKIICFPELSVTGYTCGDLFLQDALLNSAKNELVRVIKETEKLDIVSLIGVPLAVCGKLYNCAVIVNKGKAVGAVAKKNIPNYSEFYEVRHFTAADENLCADIQLDNEYQSREVFQSGYTGCHDDEQHSLPCVVIVYRYKPFYLPQPEQEQQCKSVKREIRSRQKSRIEPFSLNVNGVEKFSVEKFQYPAYHAAKGKQVSGLYERQHKLPP